MKRKICDLAEGKRGLEQTWEQEELDDKIGRMMGRLSWNCGQSW